MIIIIFCSIMIGIGLLFFFLGSDWACHNIVKSTLSEWTGIAHWKITNWSAKNLIKILAQMGIFVSTHFQCPELVADSGIESDKLEGPWRFYVHIGPWKSVLPFYGFYFNQMVRIVQS